MKAELVQRFSRAFESGSRMEAVVWRVPAPVPPSEHCYKYRLVYLVDGARVVGFDNERGKGDHKHVGDAELAYVFRGVEQLVEDFLMEIERWDER